MIDLFWVKDKKNSQWMSHVGFSLHKQYVSAFGLNVKVFQLPLDEQFYHHPLIMRYNL